MLFDLETMQWTYVCQFSDETADPTIYTAAPSLGATLKVGYATYPWQCTVFDNSDADIVAKSHIIDID